MIEHVGEDALLNQRMISELKELGIYEEIVALFRTENVKRLQELARLGTVDREKVGALLHLIRGSALNVGAQYLVDALAAAERCLERSEQFSMAELERAMEITMSALEAAGPR
jgi:hypothetical protein